MSLFLKRIVIPKNIKRFYLDLYKIFPPRCKNDHFKPGNYSNLAIFTKLKVYYRPSCTYLINNRWKHNESERNVQDHIQEFEEILQKIKENEIDLTINEITFYVDAITQKLDDLSFEKHHTDRLLKNESFYKLFKAIDISIDQMSIDNLITTLKLCKALRIPFNTGICFKMIQKLRDNFEDLCFADKVSYWFFLRNLTNSLEDTSDCIKNNNKLARNILDHEIMTKRLNLNSPENTAAALAFVQCCYFMPSHCEEDVLNAVLGLKDWNDSSFFRNFFKIGSKLTPSIQKEFYHKYLSRIKQEVFHDHLHFFLREYEKAVEANIIDYDEHLVDTLVDKILKSKPKTEQIKVASVALNKMRHGHSGLVEYLINFLRRNTYIYISHPYLSSSIISYLAFFSSYADKNQLEILDSVLKDNLNIIEMLKFWRLSSRNDLDAFEVYFRRVTDLALLEIFIDEELNYLSDLAKRCFPFKQRRNFRELLLALNQGVKIFHPNFPNSLLSEDIIRDLVKEFPKGPKFSEDRLELLHDLNHRLSKKFDTANCILTMTRNKLGFLFDGFVAVNSKGQLYDFRNQNKITIEDISLPADFQLIALLIVFEQLFGKNSLCIKPICSFRLKIQETLGFPTVILYAPIFKKLNDHEKVDHLQKMISEKISKKNEAKTCSM